MTDRVLQGNYILKECTLIFKAHFLSIMPVWNKSLFSFKCSFIVWCLLQQIVENKQSDNCHLLSDTFFLWILTFSIISTISLWTWLKSHCLSAMTQWKYKIVTPFSSCQRWQISQRDNFSLGIKPHEALNRICFKSLLSLHANYAWNSAGTTIDD